MPAIRSFIVAALLGATGLAWGDPALPKAAATDPLEMLREKLAAKLGATKAPDAKSPYVVRVSNGAGGEFQVSAGTRRANATASRPAKPSKPSGVAAVDGAVARPSLCDRGLRQSPIDLVDPVRVDLEPIAFHYGASAFQVIDNGRTLKVGLADEAAIEVRGERYTLADIQVRRPAEERIDGREFEFGLHLHHRSADGRSAVLALLLERGAASPALQQVLNNLPLEKGEPQVARGTLDLASLVPAGPRYYTYLGSLTTPPCDEGVQWLVMESPLTLAPQQAEILARLVQHNARPLQAANGRRIMASN